MEKYKELYDLSKESLSSEQGRFNRVDQKASIYLGALTFLLGVETFFIRWAGSKLVPPRMFLEWVIVILIGLLLLISFLSWCFIFGVLRIANVHKIAMNEDAIKFFRDNRLINIYYASAKRNKDAYQYNVITTNRKIWRLTVAYRLMMTAVSLIVLLGLSIGAYGLANQDTPCKEIKGNVRQNH